MRLSELLVKMARGQALTAGELQELEQKANIIDAVDSLVASWIVPGTSVPHITSLQSEMVRIDNGDVVLDDAGIFIKNNAEAALSFGDTNNTRGVIYIVSGLSSELALVNTVDGKDITFQSANIKMVSNEVNGVVRQYLLLSDTSTPSVILKEDPAQAGVLLQSIGAGGEGARMTMDGGADQALVDFRTEGTAAGATFMRMRETSRTPPIPGSGADAFHMYMKGDKVIVQFNSGGTLHYFYLDLTATTNQSWIYSATAP